MHENRPGNRTGNLLGAAALTVSDRLTRAAATASAVSVSGTAAMVTLLTSPGLGVTRLGARIGLSQPACARMLDQLSARGLVTRRRAGGRDVVVELTDAGREAARDALSARRRELGDLVDHLTGEQRRALVAGLEPLLDALFTEVGSEYVLCRLCDRPACVRGGRTCPVGAAARACGGGRDGAGPVGRSEPHADG